MLDINEGNVPFKNLRLDKPKWSTNIILMEIYSGDIFEFSISQIDERNFNMKLLSSP